MLSRRRSAAVEVSAGDVALYAALRSGAHDWNGGDTITPDGFGFRSGC